MALNEASAEKTKETGPKRPTLTSPKPPSDPLAPPSNRKQPVLRDVLFISEACDGNVGYVHASLVQMVLPPRMVPLPAKRTQVSRPEAQVHLTNPADSSRGTPNFSSRYARRTASGPVQSTRASPAVPKHAAFAASNTLPARTSEPRTTWPKAGLARANTKKPKSRPACRIKVTSILAATLAAELGSLEVSRPTLRSERRFPTDTPILRQACSSLTEKGLTIRPSHRQSKFIPLHHKKSIGANAALDKCSHFRSKWACCAARASPCAASTSSRPGWS